MAQTNDLKGPLIVDGIQISEHAVNFAIAWDSSEQHLYKYFRCRSASFYTLQIQSVFVNTFYTPLPHITRLDMISSKSRELTRVPLQVPNIGCHITIETPYRVLAVIKRPAERCPRRTVEPLDCPSMSHNKTLISEAAGLLVYYGSCQR